jgi:hypothetical protein
MVQDESQLHATAALLVLALYSNGVQDGHAPSGQAWVLAATAACTRESARGAVQGHGHMSKGSLAGSSSASSSVGLCLRVVRALGLHQGRCFFSSCKYE